MLQGKTVILGVTGSIAAYKAASLASALAKLRCDVQVILTKNAAQFITPLTFEELTGNLSLIHISPAKGYTPGQKNLPIPLTPPVYSDRLQVKSIAIDKERRTSHGKSQALRRRV